MAIYARHDLDQQQQARAMHRVWELAMTGRHADTGAILDILRAEGHPEPERWVAPALVRSSIDDVCGRAASLCDRPIPDPHPDLPDEAAIWQLVASEYAAFWSRDFDAWARCQVRSPRFRFQVWVREEGMTLRQGWEGHAARVRDDFLRDPVANPLFALGTRLTNRRLTVMGDMAWCSYDAIYPTADLPGFRGPGDEQGTRVLERHEGRWLSVFVSFFNLNFGQTDAPLWEIDPLGTVLWQNPAASIYLAGAADVVLRGGRLRMRDPATDGKLTEAISAVAQAEFGYLSRRRALPVVYDPGNDLPATVWWVVAEHGKLTLSFNDRPLLLARLDTAAGAFGLSAAQHRLAAALVEGLALPDAAARDGIGLSTAKTQLQRIFDKVGVRTQPALVRALLAVTERN